MFKIILLLAFINPVYAGAPCEFRDKVSGPGFKNAVWGLSVRDAATGAELVACDSARNLVPASILKLFVTGAALELLGPETGFRTRVYLDGTVSKGVLNGAVYLRGGGDPSFGSGLIKGAPAAAEEFGKWLQALKKAGVAEINGPVVADDSLFNGPALPGSWAWEDVGNYYAAQPSALSINDNLYKLYFRPGVRAGDRAELLRSEPEIPGLRFTNLMLTGPKGSGDNGYIFNFPGQYSAVLRGTVPQGPPESAIKGAIPDPALFAAQEFTEYLSTHGVKVGGKAAKLEGTKDYGAAKFLAESEGAPLSDIVFYTNKRSFNLYAEILLRQLALAKGKSGTAESGISVLREYLAENGVNVSELKLADASGLSRLNLANADDFTVFLSAISKKKFFGAYLASLISPADPDATGHVKNMGVNTKLEKSLKIKSGSLSGVRGYAGYLTTKKGRLLSFASILNNYTAPAAKIDRLHEALLLELIEKY
ncbi:MAG: D-alanyl-D-alanine carboxypeptidase/D-alanyl-D-alanine-endopeptidase [Elusimicrobia bacterium GWA2_56_46]|nr:MAG: D-alanyl-D-alanine carboxypeptidase/D-alanyl-D-alanine-endopeptidase [Elusimicrobia bacterium GWA2_56_46]OGR56329.1 MAG: D-alanyl-D-alanine carboxypeptidase/D-alanyl-D-alanine-endopeptidase [Elusimicrobia bacterium GWC2_56_31]HBB67717.1 D-alanyl-D-alanine carboxypeptidase/D-alanyl-D-alanine-endopeptidase [Elusimicrobiota bacterium]HBW22520.1 D-alanyl-D-alanine carboxypeptidase/D-alanyl-D-alanine-endopeptidase [Elusimicrobiota bacterium]